MKVVQITQSFFTHGGVMKRSRQETLALLKAGHQVIVITDIRWTSHMYQFEEFKDKVTIIPLKPVYIYGQRNVSSQITFTLRTYFALKNLLKKQKIDLIVCHQAVACYAAAPLGKRFKIPTVLVIQDIIRDRIATGNPYNRLETNLFKKANLYAFKNMNFTIVVSKYNKKLVILDGADPKNTYIKYNAVNTEFFKPIANPKKDIDILFIGRLSIEKGIDILIDSLKFVENEKKVLIIGEGPLKDPLIEKANKEKSHQIKFEGFVIPQLLPDYINRAKLVVTPSRSECQASVPIEAMACGVPVIASRVSGMEDSIQDKKTGWLLDKNDPIQLGRQINTALEDDSYREKIGFAALEYSKNFSEKRFFNEIIAFFEFLIQKYKTNFE